MLEVYENVRNEIVDLYKYRMVVVSFVSSTLKMRYKRSFLGFIWSLLGPLMNYCIIGFVFSKLARFEQPNYLSYVLFGSLSFNFFNAALQLGGLSLINNENYIKKIYLPKSTFVFSAMGMEFVNFLFGIIAASLVVCVLGRFEFSMALLSLPLSLFIVMTIALSLGILLSIIFVYFRDVVHILPIVMQALFFATPIVYPKSAVPLEYQTFLDYNPLLILIDMIRYPLSFGVMPPIKIVVSMFIVALVLFIFAVNILRIFANRIVFKL